MTEAIVLVMLVYLVSFLPPIGFGKKKLQLVNGIGYPIWGLGEEFLSLFVSSNEALTYPEYGTIGVLGLGLAVLLLLIMVV